MSDAFTIAANLRVASLSIAVFHFAEVLPRGWRLLRDSQGLTVSVVLFVLINTTSVCALALSNVGFFYPHFTVASCARFYLLPPAFKVIQAMVSQAIMGVRAINLSRRNRVIIMALFVYYIVTCTLEWITTLHQRTPDMNADHGK
ncbi:hypothetical protein BD626DRAFT_624645 [Schizophyllum amplum]|uniref:Uncharacterized protein n=1 Tax=Schizophyllum amplum TaxID=97359 RepID=A0A550CWU2_9AGAR|nr:hypothetical protein BD626DRAFT_624645 [Auriculariopsis ampla]